MMSKLFGIVFFCGLFSSSQEVISGLSYAISQVAMENVLSNAIIQDGLLQQHMQGLVLPTIISDGDLLNSPTSITGLHLVKVRLPRLSVLLVSGIGIKVTVSARLQLSGSSLIGLLPEAIDIFVDVKITANIKCTNFESGIVQVVIDDCLCVLGTVKINLLSGLLSVSTKDVILAQLTATLPGLLCPVFHIVINTVNIQLMGTINSVMPVGRLGTIHYQLASLPFTSGLFLGLDLDGSVKHAGGSIIPHDSSPSTLPPLVDNLLTLTLRQNFLNAVLTLMVQIPQQILSCTPESFTGAKQLQDAVSALIPAEDLHLNIQVSISGGKLLLVLSLGSLSLALESSDVGITDVSRLKPQFSNLVVEVLMPLLNAALSVGIPLPNVLGIPLVKAVIRILLGQLVILV